MSQLFTDRLWQRVEPIWRSYLDHPFVKRLGDGTLEKGKFKHWLKQDYVYLIDYARLFAIGSAKAEDLANMTTFAKLLHGVLDVEMDLHRKYAAEFGISKKELEATEPSAITTAYTSYMLNLSQRGGVDNVVASVLACEWSYNYIGKSLAKWPGALDDNFYRSWIEMYSSNEFTDLAEETKQLMNQVAEGKPERDLAQIEEIVVKTSQFEYMFWDMVDNKENWPVNA
ncbi:thiaminase II [Gracilibacillus kekensis]|uniref:Aminopyrimidine aminohydrolase n=1 Tax=Gracilibacillus kekensis TaxID=1027249 RepID=A0A1M7PZD0_9BACI|nr:thiaminase II [Gracilibacillus kekensis]SHN23131.1 thiaminase (transcriptional activator TenA) [Gracilibacillus kekensis]